MEMEKEVKFVVYGRPVGKARLRVTKYGAYTLQKKNTVVNLQDIKIRR